METSRDSAETAKVVAVIDVGSNSLPMAVAQVPADGGAHPASETPDEALRRPRLHQRTMRPLGDAGFVGNPARLLARRKPGTRRDQSNPMKGCLREPIFWVPYIA